MTGSTSLLGEAQTKGSKKTAHLSFVSITKRFGQVLANDSVSFDIKGGGIHAIIGENGAGKSTLTNILAGYYQPDVGSIHLDDKHIVCTSAAQARRLGIGMVHQQLALVPSFTGFENVLLGDSRVPFVLNKTALERKVALRARELGFNFDLSHPVSTMGIAERQKLEIFKLLWRDARVLILDEPTSQLAPLEADEILRLADDLAASGRIVVLITHHINEVIRFAKHITVLRKGKVVADVDAKKLSADELASLMVEFDESLPAKTEYLETEDKLLQLENISTDASLKNRALKNINLTINKGEVIGVAGITGAGQAELAQVLAGLLKPINGTILWKGQAVKAIAGDSVSYVPGEQNQACAAGLSLSANCFLKDVNSASAQWFGFIKKPLMNKHAQNIIESFKVSPPLVEVPCTALSGGNLQRLIIGRELATASSIIVVDNPSAGLDAGTSIKVRQELCKAADSGRSVIFISPDVDELITVCDRIIVMFNGCIIGEQTAGNFNSQSLGLLMGGVGADTLNVLVSVQKNRPDAPSLEKQITGKAVQKKKTKVAHD